jgi:tRNA threonylcarbamoyladenosine biosynthesis protein TsaE
MIELRSASPKETERIAAALARELRPGDVVTVAGDLGTGKTTFIRGACRELGVASPVTSPTYTVGNRYCGAVDVSHLDLYRFDSLSDAEWGDLERYFEDAVVFVEWPEAGAGFLPRARAEVRLQHAEETLRLITLSSAEKSLEKRVLSLVDPRV